MARHRGVSRASKRDGGKPKRGCRDVHISFRCPSKIVTRSVELMRGHASSCAAGHWGVGSLFGVSYAKGYGGLAWTFVACWPLCTHVFCVCVHICFLTPPPSPLHPLLLRVMMCYSPSLSWPVQNPCVDFSVQPAALHSPLRSSRQRRRGLLPLTPVLKLLPSRSPPCPPCPSLVQPSQHRFARS